MFLWTRVYNEYMTSTTIYLRSMIDLIVRLLSDIPGIVVNGSGIDTADGPAAGAVLIGIGRYTNSVAEINVNGEWIVTLVSADNLIRSVHTGEAKNQRRAVQDVVRLVKSINP